MLIPHDSHRLCPHSRGGDPTGQVQQRVHVLEFCIPQSCGPDPAKHLQKKAIFRWIPSSDFSMLIAAEQHFIWNGSSLLSISWLVARDAGNTRLTNGICNPQKPNTHLEQRVRRWARGGKSACQVYSSTWQKFLSFLIILRLWFYVRWGNCISERISDSPNTMQWINLWETWVLNICPPAFVQVFFQHSILLFLLEAGSITRRGFFHACLAVWSLTIPWGRLGAHRNKNTARLNLRILREQRQDLFRLLKHNQDKDLAMEGEIRLPYSELTFIEDWRGVER